MPTDRLCRTSRLARFEALEDRHMMASGMGVQVDYARLATATHAAIAQAAAEVLCQGEPEDVRFDSGSAHTGGGQGAGKVNVQDMSFTKYVDKSSPDLLLNCCNGKHIDKAVLVVRRAGEQPLEYLTITMQDWPV